jgi:hypothetical protein
MSRLRALIREVLGRQTDAPPRDEPYEENAELLRRRASTALRLAEEIADDRAAPGLRALAAELEARATQLNPPGADNSGQNPQNPAPAGKFAMPAPHRLRRSA